MSPTILISIARSLWASRVFRLGLAIVTGIALLWAGHKYLENRAVERERHRQEVLRLDDRNKDSDRLHAVLQAQKDSAALLASRAADSATQAALRASRSFNTRTEPVRRRLETDNSPVGADTVRQIIRDAYQMRLNDSLAIFALEQSVAAERVVSSGLRTQLGVVVAQRDSAMRLALRGSPNKAPKYGATLGPFIGIGYGAGKDLKPQPVIAVGFGISWGRRLGAR